MDFIRYVIGLLVFLGTSFVLVFTVHLVVLRRTRRKDAALSSLEH